MITCEGLRVLLAWAEGELTEGQVCRYLGVERVDARALLHYNTLTGIKLAGKDGQVEQFQQDHRRCGCTAHCRSERHDEHLGANVPTPYPGEPLPEGARK